MDEQTAHAGDLTHERTAYDARRLHAVVVLLVGELAGAHERRLSARALDRWTMRVFCVVRYEQSTRSRAQRRDLQSDQVRRIDREARSLDAAWHCPVRRFQEWLRAYTGPQGIWGLLHPYDDPRRAGRGRSVHCRGERRGRRTLRSPEAVAYFRRVYVDAGSQKVSRCHRIVLTEAIRKGWSWPASASATRRWVRLGGLKIQRG